MKKLMCALAAVAAGVAMADGVQSANIVGYVTRDINNMFKMSAAQFETCADQEVALNGAITCKAAALVNAWEEPYDEYIEAEGWMDRAPQIQIPKVGEVGYKYYFYVSDARNPDDDENAGEGWADSTGYYTTDAVPTAFGLWIRGLVDGENEVVDTEFTFNGVVNSDDTQSMQVEDMFKLRAIPYPVNACLNDNLADWGSFLTPVNAWEEPYDEYIEAEGWMDAAPQIQVPKVGEVGYKYYFYVSDARNPADDENAGEGWADSTGYYTTDAIPAGYSIWFNARRDSVEIPINNPTSK